MGSIAPVSSQAKVALITGGSTGIGADLARRLHSRGYLVAIASRRAAEGEAIARSLDPTGATAMFAACDVSSYRDQTAVFAAVHTRWGRLDVFVANAGIVDRDSKYNLTRRDARAGDLPPEPDTACIDADLKGVVYGTVLAVHFMRRNEPEAGGKIIVTGSMLGTHLGVCFPEYAAAKAGAHHWVRTMAPLLLRKDKVTINVIMPGAYDTSIMPGFSDAFLPQHLVKKETLMQAYDLFISPSPSSAQRTGQAVEVAHDKLFFYDVPEYKSGDVARRNELPYEPWFARIHGEPSGLPSAVKRPFSEEEKRVGRADDGEVKLIVVTGATGSQGGGVVNIMRRTPGWRVRAVTRNPDGDKARELASQGIEVVRGDFDDENSLVKAFEGAHAVFAVTNWWEHLFRGKPAAECGPIEEEQGMRLARAAARTQTLEHYVWSTEPSAARMTRGALSSPHMDFKANVDARIRLELPLLARRTTYLYLGYYPQNMAFFPCLKPVFNPALGKHVQTLATSPDAKILLAGDITVNPGIWVRQVLAAGSRAFGRIANVALERWSYQQMMDEWSRVTGKPGVLVQCTGDAWERMWGPVGAELVLQFRFGELYDPWVETEAHISAKELGIDDNEVVGFTGTIDWLNRKGIFNE